MSTLLISWQTRLYWKFVSPIHIAEIIKMWVEFEESDFMKILGGYLPSEWKLNQADDAGIVKGSVPSTPGQDDPLPLNLGPIGTEHLSSM
jgi:hypothetical protein